MNLALGSPLFASDALKGQSYVGRVGVAILEVRIENAFKRHISLAQRWQLLQPT
jgi:hypothetical protein